MSRKSNKIVGSLAAALATAAIVPATSAGKTDFRSPDARDAAAASQARSYQDLRSPDARDVGAPPQSSSVVATDSGGSSGSAWDEIGLAAGGFLTIVLIGFGMRTLVMRHSRTAREPRTPVISS